MQHRISSFAGRLKNASGFLTAGSMPQTILEEDLGRRYLLVQNKSDVKMYINFGVDAVPINSIKLEAGSSIVFEFSFVPIDYVSLYCDFSNKEYVCFYA